MNDCPECGSSDIDVAPAGSRKDLECQECGHRFNAGDEGDR